MNTSIRAGRLAAALVMAIAVVSMGLQDATAQQTDDYGSLGKSTRAGTAGALELLVPSTARNASLGNNATSGLSTMSGLEGLYSNPAALSVNSGTGALFSRMEYVADIGVNYFGIAQRIGSNNLAFTLTTWDFGDIALQTELDPEKSDVTWRASNLVAGITYARQLTDRIAAGATFKAVNETIASVGGTAIAFDAGMTYLVGESGLRMGVSLKNIGSDLRFSGTGLVYQVKLPDQEPGASTNAVAIESAGVELPSLLNFGIAYTRALGSQGSVTLLGNFRSNSFDQDQIAGGIELGFQDIVYVRGGYQYQQDADLTFFTGASLGAGLNLNLGSNRLSVDYAYIPTDYLDAVQYITASVTL